MVSLDNGAGLKDLPCVVDSRGSLVFGEVPESLPFVVKRFFYVFNVPQGESRGIHAHKQCHQFLICVAGSVKALLDDGANRVEHSLTAGGPGLYMPPLTWGSQYDYSQDAVLLVLASHQYDAADYIHDYVEFLTTSRGAST